MLIRKSRFENLYDIYLEVMSVYNVSIENSVINQTIQLCICVRVILGKHSMRFCLIFLLSVVQSL